jgi:LuxR family transcriptional regulator, maltose regulon positive regulatory protein
MKGGARAGSPVSRRRIIKRPRLTRMLDESGARIILLVAPAGYGKTTLAHEWLDSKQAAWYRGSPASADVAALAVGLATAAAEVAPGAGERMRQRLRATDRPEEDARILAELLAEDLAEWPSDAWLVINDYQFAMESPACEEFVEVLLDRAKPRVLITSRRRPRWATARRRVYGSVFELDRTLLAMNAEEAQDLLSERTDAAELIRQAAGWPAVIGLAALTVPQQTTLTELPSSLYDFFAEELLHAVDAAHRISLCELAFMPSITDQAATHLLGRHLASQTLSEGVEAGVLQPGRGHRYELHPLLRAFLQERFVSLAANVSLTVARVGVFLLMHREWDDALALAKQFRSPDFLDAFIESAWEPLLDEGRLATLASLIDLASELRVRSSLVDLVESDIAFRQGAYRKAEALAMEASRGLRDDHLRVHAYVRAGQSAHLEGRDAEAIAHHRRAQQVARTTTDQREAVWGEFTSSLELESDCATLLSRLEQFGADDSRDSIRLANGRILWAIRSGSGIHPDLFSAVHTLCRVDDPLIRSSFLQTWATLLVYTGRYADALQATNQQIRELRQHRLEFAMPHTLVNEALALRGLRRFRQALKRLAQAERGRPIDDRVVVASNAVRIGIHVAQHDFGRAIGVPQPSDSTSVAANVVAELIANRAVALACAGQAKAAATAALKARALTTEYEPHVVSKLAEAIIALAHKRTDRRASLAVALSEVRRSGYVDSFVTAYRGVPDLLREAAVRDTFGSELAAIVSRANDIPLAKKTISGVQVISHNQEDPLSEREREVLGLVARGMRNRDIAEQLFISEVTVKAHMRNIMRKLGARSRAHAVSLAEPD